MFELTQLRQLLAIAKFGTLSKAAEELYLSQPALTRSMQKLEQDLDAQLFDRSKNKIVLNSVGKLAVECAKKVLSEVDLMTERVQVYQRSVSSISLGVCTPSAQCVMTPIISEQFVNKTIISDLCDVGQLLAGLDKGKYQVIVLPYPVERADLVCKELCKEQLMISVMNTHRFANREEVTLNDLKGESLITLKNVGYWESVIGKMKDINIIYQDDNKAIVDIIKATGISCFSSNITEIFNQKPENRVHIPIVDESTLLTYYYVYKKSSNANF